MQLVEKSVTELDGRVFEDWPAWREVSDSTYNSVRPLFTMLIFIEIMATSDRTGPGPTKLWKSRTNLDPSVRGPGSPWNPGTYNSF